MYLLAGLGNPGLHYSNTRHNLGFMLVDRLASESGERFDHLLPTCQVCSVERLDRRLILAKPMTYMNRSGVAVRELLTRYSADPRQLIVAYDDVALPLGSIRLRTKGTAGGQKGMRSIIDAVGTPEIARLRMGIDGERSPADLTDYVLSEFGRKERLIVEEVLDQALLAIDTILTHGFSRAMALHNRRTESIDESEGKG